jgi:hypothetical protein
MESDGDREPPVDLKALRDQAHSEKRAADEANRREIERFSQALRHRACLDGQASGSRLLGTEDHSPHLTCQFKSVLLLLAAIMVQRVILIARGDPLTPGFIYAGIDVAVAAILLYHCHRSPAR